MYLAIIALPLFASIITGVLNRSIPRDIACYITSVCLIMSAVLSCIAFYEVGILGKIIDIKLIEWINLGSSKANWSIYIDQLTSIMLIVVTFVSAAVHVYSVGYMNDDQALPRFMSYLSLFTVFMLLMLTSDNFLQLFFGWEGVGLCSYLLIGFWYKKNSANLAATKAFVVNRVGDFGFMLGVILIYLSCNSLEFKTVFDAIPAIANNKINYFGIDFNLAEMISMLLFIGSMGKSAQIGLHVWLPDAMEGPTPVSALIHAATMVTAGVFLVARCSYIFEYAPQVREFIVVIGSITCVFAALVAVCQNDIKKIIAYSTCSQLGYMFIACGLSKYQAGIFHLYTHAFFKAMLFLAAGSVIHALHEQDIRKMGGLKKQMPITYAIFWLGSLSIMGIFPLSGYYSKDFILMAAFNEDTVIGDIGFKSGLLAAFFTAIYSMKIIFKVFHGSPALKKKRNNDLEPSPVMNFPLGCLALGTVLAGFGANAYLDITTPIYGFFKGSLYFKEYEIEEHLPFSIEMLPTIVAIGGMIVGYLVFATKLSERIAKTFNILNKLVVHKFYFDEIYDYLFVRANDCLANILKIFDKNVIDFLGPTMASHISYFSSVQIAKEHNGKVTLYALAMVTGLIFGLTLIMYYFV